MGEHFVRSVDRYVCPEGQGEGIGSIAGDVQLSLKPSEIDAAADAPPLHVIEHDAGRGGLKRFQQGLNKVVDRMPDTPTSPHYLGQMVCLIQFRTQGER